MMILGSSDVEPLLEYPVSLDPLLPLPLPPGTAEPPSPPFEVVRVMASTVSEVDRDGWAALDEVDAAAAGRTVLVTGSAGLASRGVPCDVMGWEGPDEAKRLFCIAPARCERDRCAAERAALDEQAKEAKDRRWRAGAVSREEGGRDQAPQDSRNEQQTGQFVQTPAHTACLLAELLVESLNDVVALPCPLSEISPNNLAVRSLPSGCGTANGQGSTTPCTMGSVRMLTSWQLRRDAVVSPRTPARRMLRATILSEGSHRLSGQAATV